MSKRVFSGGTKLQEKLKELSKLADKSATLRVGFFEGSTEEKSDLPSAYIAMCNEFGGTIPEHTVPEHVAKIYRKVGKNGNFLNGAKFTKKGQSNFETEHIVPEHVVPEHTTPPRAFFRRMINLGKPHWGGDLSDELIESNLNADIALGRMGERMTDELKNSIQARVYAPNAKSTIDRKGHDQTLIDSGDMLNAVAFQIGGKQ